MNILRLNEVNQKDADSIVEAYVRRYADQFEAYTGGSVRSKVQESISSYELMALGQQLDQYSAYQNYVQESMGNLGALGVIPTVALDVVSASVGASVLPLLCSIQPVQEEHSVVWYKAIRAAQNGGGYNKGDIIRDPLTLDNPGDGTLGSTRKMEELGATGAAVTELTGTLSNAPLRPYTMEFQVPGLGGGKDDGNGKILGFGFNGTINYETGDFAITLHEASTDGAKAQVIYDLEIDQAQSIDKIKAGLMSKEIKTKIYALGADTGTFANFAFGQRFGRSAAQEAAQDLRVEMTNILNVEAVRRIAAMAGAEGREIITWDKFYSEAVSYAENKLTFIDIFAQSETQLHKQSGVGSIQRILAGANAATVLAGMPEFTRASADSGQSIGLYGTYNNAPVVRATGVVSDNRMVNLANPNNYFNAPLAYSPYMPLIMTNTVSSPNNPFASTQAAGMWSGMTELNTGLVTAIDITDSTPAKS